MSNTSTSFTLTLDDVEVQAYPGETLWQVAKRAGETIPHLCFKDAPGYRADGNCRACMVEVEGERVLAAHRAADKKARIQDMQMRHAKKSIIMHT